jgi:hypothetical protein
MKKEIEFTVDKVWDADAVVGMLNLIDDIVKNSGYKVNYSRIYRRFKVIIEGGDNSESRS